MLKSDGVILDYFWCLRMTVLFRICLVLKSGGVI